MSSMFIGPGAVISQVVTTYRKTTSKTVNSTVAATDLLNGEITIAAGVMGPTGFLRLTAFGDWLNNNALSGTPQWQLLLGGTTLFDTQSQASVMPSGSARKAWRIVVEIINQSASAQTSHFQYWFGVSGTGTATAIEYPFATAPGLTQSAFDGATSFLMLGDAQNNGSSVNTNVANALVLNIINGSSNILYETRLLGAVVEIF